MVEENDKTDSNDDNVANDNSGNDYQSESGNSEQDSENDLAYAELGYTQLADDDIDDDDDDDNESTQPNQQRTEPEPPILIAQPSDLLPEDDLNIIKSVMLGIKIPDSAVPDWAKAIPEEKWIPKVEVLRFDEQKSTTLTEPNDTSANTADK
ncbi:hypothetical protein HK100_002973 [Physocladia obscura]|uniref:Male-enhanced antigen 1 n=1 Tax=Physocladia obscura TaxID=109957 RepID=A0AAD5T9F2_9FUNG|nr:hypothetical protein HK100_002973 [Physocladia obscura]